MKKLVFSSAKKINGIQVAKGIIASGDLFMNDSLRVDFVQP